MYFYTCFINLMKLYKFLHTLQTDGFKNLNSFFTKKLKMQ